MEKYTKLIITVFFVCCLVSALSDNVSSQRLSIVSVDVDPIRLYQEDGSICAHVVHNGTVFSEGELRVRFSEDDGWGSDLMMSVGFDSSKGCYHLSLDYEELKEVGNYSLNLVISAGDPNNLEVDAYETAGTEVEVPAICACNNETWCNPNCACDIDCSPALEMGVHDFFACLDMAQLLGYSPHAPGYSFSSYGGSEYINPFLEPYSIFLKPSQSSAESLMWDDCLRMFEGIGWTAGIGEGISGSNALVEVENNLIGVESEECWNIVDFLRKSGADVVYVSTPGLNYLCSNIRQDKDPELSETAARQLFNSAFNNDDVTVVKLSVFGSHEELERECPGIMAPIKIITGSQDLPALSTGNGLMGLGAVFSVKYEGSKICWGSMVPEAAVSALGDVFSFNLDTNFRYSSSSLPYGGTAIIYGDIDAGVLDLRIPVFGTDELDVDSINMAEGGKLILVEDMTQFEERPGGFQSIFGDAIASCDFMFKEVDYNNISICNKGNIDVIEKQESPYILQHTDTQSYIFPSTNEKEVCSFQNYKLDYVGGEEWETGLRCTASPEIQSKWSSSSIDVIAVSSNKNHLAEGIIFDASTLYQKGVKEEETIYTIEDTYLKPVNFEEAVIPKCSKEVLCSFENSRERITNINEIKELNNLSVDPLDCICIEEKEDSSVLGRIVFSEDKEDDEKRTLFGNAVVRVSWTSRGKEHIRKSDDVDDEGIFKINGIERGADAKIEVSTQDSSFLQTRKCYRGEINKELISWGNDIGSLEVQEVLCSSVADWTRAPEVVENSKEKKEKKAEYYGKKIRLTAYQTEVADYIREQSKKQGIPVDIALGVAWAESRMGANAVTSGAGAQGIMQIMPSTYKDLVNRGKCPSSPDWRTNWKTNVNFGLCVLRDKYSWAKNGLENTGYGHIACNKGLTGWPAAVRAYNGLNCNARYGDPDYVEKVLAAARNFAYLA
jgi:hypothetical protein